jgi:hypothetical protein
MYRLASVLLILANLLFAAFPADASDEDAGGPAAFRVMGGIKRLPNGGRPATKVPFPDVRNWSSLEITLQRGVCFGNCAAYKVRIKDDGTIEYEGYNFVAVPGHHVGRVTEAAVRELYEEFRKADFFWLLDNYSAPITDNPAYQLDIAFDDKHKSVGDYVGRAVGMPKAVTDLENAIDTVANTKKWVTGDAETIPALKHEGVSFAAHPELLVGAAERGNRKLLEQLLALGVPANNKFGCRTLSIAAASRELEMARALFSAGAPIRYDPPGQPIAEPKTEAEQSANISYYQDFCDVLQTAADGASSQIMNSVLARHPNVNRVSAGGSTPLMSVAANSGNSYALQHGADFARCAQMLVDAGADVNATDDNGNTALMRAGGGVDVVRVMLKAGVRDINARNTFGETALMHAYRPDVAEALLQAWSRPISHR